MSTRCQRLAYNGGMSRGVPVSGLAGLVALQGRVLINRDRSHSPPEVRFAPKSGGKADVPGGPSWASSGLSPYKITLLLVSESAASI